MISPISRRTFITGAAALAATTAISPAMAQREQVRDITPGGIALSRGEFEKIYGAGTQNGDYWVYPNPYFEGSELTVLFELETATFIDMSVPAGTDPADIPSGIHWNLIPEDAYELAFFSVDAVIDTLPTTYLTLTQSDQIAAHVLLYVSSDAANNLRFSASLVNPDGGSGFTPAANSVSVLDPLDDWIAVHGPGENADAGTGDQVAYWQMAPWESVMVEASTDPNGDGIEQINAVSSQPVTEQDAMDFAQSIMPLDGELIGGFEGFSMAQGQLGYGASVRHLTGSYYALLFMHGVADGSGDVVQVAASLGYSLSA